MDPERIDELSALHAVGALDGAEAHEFAEFLLGADAAVTAEVTALSDTAALLVYALPPAPALRAHIKEALLQRIRQDQERSLPGVHFFSILASEGEWKDLPVPGVRVKDLSAQGRSGYSVKLYELAPKTEFPGHHHSGPEECFVVSGDFHVQGRVLHSGDFHHAAPGTDHDPSFTEQGCALLVIAPSEDYA